MSIKVMISGGFDPIHVGHIRYITEAVKLGDRLVVVINNDNWLNKKKGYCVMNEKDRVEILSAIKGVDEVILSSHPENPTDMSVCNEIELIQPQVFANGGDRWADNIPEFGLCTDLGISMEFNVGHGGKVRSSSELINEATKHVSPNATNWEDNFDKMFGDPMKRKYGEGFVLYCTNCNGKRYDDIKSFISSTIKGEREKITRVIKEFAALHPDEPDVLFIKKIINIINNN